MTDFLIVGGGVIGMLTARALIASGARVTVLEKGELGQESSWAGGGILSPLYPWRYPEPVNALAAWSQVRYAELCAELAEQTGIDPEWTPSGMLVLGLDDVAEANCWASARQASIETPDEEAIRGIEPALGPAPTPAVWLPDVAQVRNPRLAKALRRSLALAGADLREHTPVTGLQTAGGRVIGVETPEGAIAGGAVIVAGGAWSAVLLAPTGLSLPVEPVRGQMVLFKTPPGLIRRIVLADGRYLIPRRDGRVVVGSTVERVGFDKGLTDQALTDLKEAAIGLVPALADFPVELHWSGLRPGSPTGVPFIGPHTAMAGLYVNAGHFRNGVVMAPASARLLADLALGLSPAIPPEPFQIT